MQQPHRYKVGSVVRFTPSGLDKQAPAGSYQIVRQLPPDGSDNQYRVKSSSDGHERVVRESQLS